MADENWERTMIERLATEGLLEQQRARRWGIFFKLLGFACVFLVLFLILASIGAGERSCLDKCTALVELRGRARQRWARERRQCHRRAAGRFQGQGNAGRRAEDQQPGRKPRSGGSDQRRDSPIAQEISGHTHLRGGRGDLRVGGVLRRRGDRQDLRRQGEPRRIDRRDHGRVRLRRRDGQARRRAAGTDRRREQGLPRSVRAGRAQAEGIRAEDARRDPPAIHRRREAGSRRAAQGNARNVFRAGVERATQHRARLDRRAGQRSVRSRAT